MNHAHGGGGGGGDSLLQSHAHGGGGDSFLLRPTPRHFYRGMPPHPPLLYFFTNFSIFFFVFSDH
jgi:hypothetical protein